MTEKPDLGHLPVARRTGQEAFTFEGRDTGHTLLAFWQWACSDIVGNTFRGAIGEFIVASAAGMSAGVQVPWDACDLRLPSGTTVEIKTSGYVQTWEQKAHSVPAFSIAKSKAWNPETNAMAKEARRNSELYIFCLHHHKDKRSANPLDLDQWTFYVVPTRKIEAMYDRRTNLGLKHLADLGADALTYAGLRESLARVYS